MRSLHRTRVHRVHGMPYHVDKWREPTSPAQADVYVDADHYTEQEAHELERQLNQGHE